MGTLVVIPILNHFGGLNSSLFISHMAAVGNARDLAVAAPVFHGGAVLPLHGSRKSGDAVAAHAVARCIVEAVGPSIDPVVAGLHRGLPLAAVSEIGRTACGEHSH